MFCVGSGRCDEVITRTEEFYWMFVCVFVCVSGVNDHDALFTV